MQSRKVCNAEHTPASKLKISKDELRRKEFDIWVALF